MKKTTQDFEKIVDRLKSCLEDEAGLKRIEYILSNWMAAKLRLRHQNGVKGSSTEGHVLVVHIGRNRINHCNND